MQLILLVDQFVLLLATVITDESKRKEYIEHLTGSFTILNRILRIIIIYFQYICNSGGKHCVLLQ